MKRTNYFLWMVVLGVVFLNAIGSQMSVYGQKNTPTPTSNAQAVVQTNMLNVRSGPGTGYSILGTVRQGDILNIINHISNCSWLLVNTPNGIQGWVAGIARFVSLRVPCGDIIPVTITTTSTISISTAPISTPIAPAIPLGADAVVQAHLLNVRSAPGTKSSILGTVHQGEGLKVIGRNEDCSWLLVNTSKGIQGWITGTTQFVTLRVACASVTLGLTPSPPPSPTPSPQPSPTASNSTAKSACPADYRLQTGIYKWHTSVRGSGQLQIKNDLKDGIVTLKTLDDQPVVDAFLRASAVFTINGIPDGTYRLYFIEGSVDCNGLLTGRLQRFDDTLSMAGKNSPVMAK